MRGPALPGIYTNVYNYHCALLSPENIFPIVIIACCVAGVVVLIVVVICCCVCRKKKRNKKSGKTAQACLHLNFSVMIRGWKCQTPLFCFKCKFILCFVQTLRNWISVTCERPWTPGTNSKQDFSHFFGAGKIIWS